jgi:Ser/Thr protein kinase RdoA (MazF antagonist)
MLRVDREVDAEGRSPIADQILTRWECDPGSARFFRSSSNFVFRLRRAGQDAFLRFADSTERRARDFQSEMEIVRHLAGAGIAVATPVRSRAGGFVETVESKSGTFHAVVCGFVGGRTFEIDDLVPSRFREWGATMGRLHSAAMSLPKSALDARRSWRHDLAFAGRHIPSDRPAARRELDELLAALAALPIDAASYGLIHFDFELDNLVWQDSGICILDFDDCAQYWHVADIAFALEDVFEHGFDAKDESFAEFVRGYETERPIPAWAVAALPTFLRLAGLLRYARIRRSLDVPRSAAHPAWLTALQERLDRRLNAYEASIAER